MMIKQELVKRIREYFDLNIYETKVWIALLSKGIASASEIAVISGVPRSRTYDVLESLEKRGFAIIKIGKPVKYIAVKPVEILEKMKSHALQEAQEKVKTLTNLKDTAEYIELEQLHKTGIAPINTHEITGAFKGRPNIMARLRELVQNAKREVIISTSALDFENKSRVLLPALQNAINNNIKVKLSITGNQEKLKKIISKTKVTPKPTDYEAKVYIADRREVFFTITPDHAEEEIGVWLNAPFFAQAFASLIDINQRKK